jgi:hypothetical protein
LGKLKDQPKKQRHTATRTTNPTNLLPCEK